MPRPKRIWIPHLFYHIVCRGNRRDPLFLSTSDFQAFFHILHQLHEKISFELASYCLMTNHFHLQLRSKQVSISKVMSLINKRYANYYNTRYRLTGHVFEKRFYSSLIVDSEGMLQVSSYIHLNPVVANMVRRPEDYRWSSFPFFRNAQIACPRYLDTNHILDNYVGTEEVKRRLYYKEVMRSRERALLSKKGK